MRSSNTSKQVIVENYAKHIGSHSMMTTPRYTKWIVIMWSFGVDTPGEIQVRNLKLLLEKVFQLYI
jgi:hypothetical protein